MKILVADSEPSLRVQVARFVSACGHEVVLAEDWAQAWGLLQQRVSQIAMIGSTIAGANGSETCRRIRHEIGADSPYLLLMARSGDAPLELLEAGADDFIVNPVETACIRARLNVAVRIVELQERCSHALEPETDRDLLTGIWGRRAIAEFLRSQFARSSRDGISLAVILGDMDNFYVANAKYGYEVCDSVLRETTHRIKLSIRPYDILGRYGGEEFLVIAPDCMMSNAQVVAERFRALIAEQPFDVCGKQVQVTMSFGIATTSETGAMDAEGLLRSAGSALLVAKENGRNRVEIAKRIPRPRMPYPRLAAAQRVKELVQ